MLFLLQLQAIAVRGALFFHSQSSFAGSSRSLCARFSWSKCKRVHFASALRNYRLFVLGFSGGCLKMFSYLGKFAILGLLVLVCAFQASAQFKSSIEGTVTESS